LYQKRQPATGLVGTGCVYVTFLPVALPAAQRGDEKAIPEITRQAPDNFPASYPTS
jgi:hypothetical protein